MATFFSRWRFLAPSGGTVIQVFKLVSPKNGHFGHYETLQRTFLHPDFIFHALFHVVIHHTESHKNVATWFHKLT